MIVLSCPCCGGKPEIFYDENDHSIYCQLCSCGVTDWNKTLKELVLDWNARSYINNENIIKI